MASFHRQLLGTAKLETSCILLSEVQVAKLEVAIWAEAAMPQCLQT